MWIERSVNPFNVQVSECTLSPSKESLLGTDAEAETRNTRVHGVAWSSYTRNM